MKAGVCLYFSDWFEINPGMLSEYGAFNISLLNDLPLFIDPFLLFTSKKKIYQKLHKDIIDYLVFIRDQSASGQVNSGLLKAWFRFPEVKQLWLGYSLCGNRGSGLGMDFARALNNNLHVIFNNFGQEQITKGSHLEKICLIESGVGRDNISDFTANLIKDFLCTYTQKFARDHIKPAFRRMVSVSNTVFDYSIRVWLPKEYELPYFNDDFVLLTPKDILTKDENWINRPDMISGLERIANSVSDEQLRSQVNQYLSTALYKGRKKQLTQEERAKVFNNALKKYPQLVEYYIRSKEDRGQEAISISASKVLESEDFYIKQVSAFIVQLAKETDFYKHGIDTYEEAKQRVLFLKQVIENNDGYKLFYHNGKAIQRESDLQILYRFTWFASPSDFNSEVNNGRGPVDFKISRGSKDKSLVEFKLAKNSQLKRNLQNQTAIYEKANDTPKSLKVIFYFSAEEKAKVDSIIKELGLQNETTIILVDVRADNKPSASKT